MRLGTSREAGLGHAQRQERVPWGMANTRFRRCIHWTGSPGAAEHRDVRERPRHRGLGLVGIHPTPRAPRYDLCAVLEVRGEHTRDGFAPLLLTLRVRRAVAFACAVKSSEVEPGSRDERDESSHGRSCASLRPRHTVHPEHKIQRFQHHVGRAVPERLLVAVHHSTLAIHLQALGGNGRAR